MKTLNDIYPELRSKLTGKYIKLLTDTDEERRELLHKLDELEFQYFAIKPKAERPIKVVIKGLPRHSNPKDIENDLVELGFTVDKVSQLIGRISKQPLPIFLVSLPRNIFNAKIFELKKVSFMNVTVDGYDGKGVTQCYSCNRFHHTAENCHITPRCLKCGDAHQTRECEIERVEKPYCINCETYRHMANYSGCPKFPKPRKGSQEKSNTHTNTVNSIVRPGTSYSQAAKTSNSTKSQQMAPQVKGNPAALVTNQANLTTLPNPPSINFNNNGTFDMNFITQTLQQTILALSMLTQHIGNAVSIPPPPPVKSKKPKNKEQLKKELHALFEAIIDFDDD
ncbi:nucleic-acid-binding protein from transposon X-element [Trichonephila clavipes]|nr:nucleic-acid-binding protein from transposon X-element [Trichonephila clavipes]